MSTIVNAKNKINSEFLRIGQVWQEQGGIYAGIIRGENGEPDYHVVHATDEHEISKANWNTACEAGKKTINAFDDWSLPNRREARLLAINSPDNFDKDEWYWTSTQVERNTDYAWVQYFYNGTQDILRKSCEGCARAVRRILIIQ